MSVWAIHEGDCIDVMRTLAPESIDTVITSPPYAMQRKATYGGVPEADYPEWTVAWMREVRRVLKPDGSVVINIRPHIKNGQISDYTLRTRLALREDGWAELEELIWFKRSAPPAGRIDRPRRSYESLHWFGKHGSAYANPKANGSPIKKPTNLDRSSPIDPVAVGQGWSHAIKGTREGIIEGAKGRSRDVVEINLGRKSDEDRRYRHPATYPPALAEWVAHLACPPGGTILDPFNGSGSTGVAAIRNDWSYVGIDAVPEYAAMSRARLASIGAA